MKFSILAVLLLQCATYAFSQDDGIYTIGSGCAKLTIENGNVEPALGYGEESYPVFTEVMFKCNDSFITVGQTSSMCREDGTWSNTESPCKAGCRAPVVTNGRATPELMSEEDYYRVGEVVSFECFGNLVLKGYAFSTCQEGGSWLQTIPECVEPEPTGCEPPEVRNGFRVTRLPSGKKMFGVGDSVFVKCNDGYVRDGRAFLTCLEDGSWDDGYSVCKVMKPRTGCAAPKFPLKDGVYMPPMSGDSYAVNTKLTFKCNQGRVMHGSQYAYCEANGEWNALPDCVPGCRKQSARSGTVSPAPNVEKEFYKFGQIITLNCKSGYRIVGPKTATCRPDGVWTAFLACYDVCDAPNVPNMKTIPAMVDGRRLYKVGQNITCKCNPGYELVGSSVIQCQSGNKYNVEIPTCKRILCDAPATVPLATYKPVQKQYAYGRKVRWVCKRGYVIRGSKYSTCGQNGEFKPAKPVCKVATDVKAKKYGQYVITRRMCFRPRIPANGYLEPKNFYYAVGAEVKYSCKPGYEMTGTARSICRETGFGTQIPVCKRVQCVEPAKPTNGRFATPKKRAYYFGDKVRYVCNTNHIMVGSAVVTCTKDGQFDSTPPSCHPPSCRVSCVYVEGRSCQCHAACRIENNCCYDFEEHCRKLFY